LHYDAILKSILQSLGNILTPSLTGGAKPVELLNVEFNAVEKRVPDLVARLDDGRVFHLEVQSANDRRMPLRMLRYWLLLREQYPAAQIVQHVLYIGGPTLSMTRFIKEGNVSYLYDVTDIRDIDEEVFLRSDSPADRALAVLSKMRNERVTIRQILASWAGASRRDRDDLIEKLMVLSGLRRLDEIVAEEVNNMPIEIDIMENTTIRRWIEQGVGKRVEHGQANLLGKQLAKRFGALTSETEEKLRAADSDQLERWALRLMDANTLDEVFSA
jgi:predicted transposase YdaD